MVDGIRTIITLNWQMLTCRTSTLQNPYHTATFLLINYIYRKGSLKRQSTRPDNL